MNLAYLTGPFGASKQMMILGLPTGYVMNHELN